MLGVKLGSIKIRVWRAGVNLWNLLIAENSGSGDEGVMWLQRGLGSVGGVWSSSLLLSQSGGGDEGGYRSCHSQ